MTTAASAPSRNPGPSWGYRFLQTTDRIVPEFIFRPLRAIGTLIAMAGMPEQRKHSRDYLRIVLEREPRWRDIFRHFFSFEEVLMKRLRIANGKHIECEYMPGAGDFRRWMEGNVPVLLGTMHVGVSDMLGFQLAGKTSHPIYLVRLRVGNSHDTDALARRYGDALRFIWVNDPKEMLFALKEALATPSALAIQCDRIKAETRLEAFDFLGGRRLFPFAIYYLSLITNRPVLLSFGLPGPGGESQLFSIPSFQRAEGESRDEALARAREHFQEFLHLLETKLREHPFMWFNFTPLNPVAEQSKEEAA